MVNGLLRYEQGELSYRECVDLFFFFYPEKVSALASFFENEDQFSRNKVHKALDEKLAEAAEQKVPKPSFEDYVPSKYIENPINVELLPADLRKEYASRIPIIREISHLQSRLKYHTGKHLTEMATRIVELSDQRRKIFIKVDTFIETGKLLTDEVKRAEPIAKEVPKNYDVEYQLKLKRAQRSKAKNNPAKIELFNRLDAEVKALEKLRY
jgi:hypothetical protein